MAEWVIVCTKCPADEQSVGLFVSDNSEDYTAKIDEAYVFPNKREAMDDSRDHVAPGYKEKVVKL